MLIKSDYKPQMRQKPVKQKKPVSTNGRIAFVLLVFALAFASAAGWSVHLHTVEQDRLQTEGNKRFVRTLVHDYRPQRCGAGLERAHRFAVCHPFCHGKNAQPRAAGAAF